MLIKAGRIFQKVKVYYRECDLVSRGFVGTGLAVEAYVVAVHKSVLLGCGFGLASALALLSVALELVGRSDAPTD